MIVESFSHRSADKILDKSKELDSLIRLLKSIKIPVRNKKTYDVVQQLINVMIQIGLEQSGWQPNPFIDIRKKNSGRKLELQGDFFKIGSDGIRILIEAEFGNTASFYRDLYKFSMADTLDSYDCGVLILPMKNLAKRIAKTQNYEKAIEEIQLGKPFLNLPILVIGVGIDENNPSCIIDIDRMIDWETIKTKNLLIDFANENNALLHD